MEIRTRKTVMGENEKNRANNRKANGHVNYNENSKIGQEEEYEEEEESGSNEEDEDGSNRDVSIEEVEEENTLITQLEEYEKSKA
eukprot:2133327-Ditylum_brightwellii.AAC.1